MADLDQEFQKAAEDAKNLKSRPTDQDLLELYALFKQATVGDNTQVKPGLFHMKEKAKHESWLTKKGKLYHIIEFYFIKSYQSNYFYLLKFFHHKIGMSKEEAKKAYVQKAKQLIETHGLS